jgi:Fur family transcriptional regulator, ferric uptake regulator
MAASVDLDRTIADRLARHDLRYTRGRRVIVGTLVRAGQPVTLPELLDLEPELAQSSTYRNLSLMEQAGVIRRLAHGGDHARYELDEELTEHHHHLICESCGAVRDVVLEPSLERTVDAALDRVARGEGFTPRAHVIDVYGRCSECTVTDLA